MNPLDKNHLDYQPANIPIIDIIDSAIIDSIRYMLNPITQKLGKLFSKGTGKRKRSKLRTEADTPLKLFSRSFLPDKENDPNASNRLNQTTLTPWKPLSIRKSNVPSQACEQQFQRVLRDNERLKEMVKTHELMEEFYLKQLERRKKEKSNLEWRLSLLNEEIQNSKRKKPPGKQSQVLRERVQAARRGLDGASRVETEPA